ncbi:YisL family protein [Pediococcus claussenii]|uniref:Uncharacterized protein n=1 Tax=Pediococcus claussenii (strain ATCC BAA-344 / DSM 14800 / JCM 18046 / KCTC 3811 / LMG 21948 / P06) TaxID=701521 RepID=G8PB50_PEDCP|nr:YisL family protein [Pediococcus claussenii]AEV94679.1 hypothetical protein PECL_370 [Pediococcus claussenii ATCC BAA-344]ANZ69874.1 hypothetical protein AYR57_05935 [Pediococcus claussenii]ANZ71691.1 hypothetical protein AYR58_05940 [Pediococcus claussenii]KRN20858.1 hypothetical protein IV79_GL000080 [Pediococcus claussenii]
MPIIAFVHVITAILLATLTSIGLMATNNGTITASKMTNRILYLVLIYTGFVMLMHTFQTSPVLVILKGLAGLGVIGLIEVAFARKQQNSEQAHTILVWLVVIFAVTAVLGMVISKFFL